MKEYAFPTASRVLLAFACTLGFVVFAWVSVEGTGSNLARIFIIIFSLTLIVYGVYHWTYRILLDDMAITVKSAVSNTMIPWREIDDLIIWPHSTTIRSSRRNLTITVESPESDQRFAIVKDSEDLRRLIVSNSLPYVSRIWSDESKFKRYEYPSPPVWGYLVMCSPVVFWLSIAYRYGIFANGSGVLIGLLPFLGISLYLAYRLGVFWESRVLILDDDGIRIKNGKGVAIGWRRVAEVTGNDLVSTIGMVIRSKDGQSITVPKSMHRFSDLAYQIRHRIPVRFKIDLSFPMS